MHDATAEKFDEWSRSGKAEDMQRGHHKSVAKMLAYAKIKEDTGFSFLDVGCGNGWVARMVAMQNPGCRRSVGIDKSAGMIRRAESHPDNTAAVRYVCTGIEDWSYRGRFDYALAMESLYYAESMEKALAKIYRLLRPVGMLLCGTDFYAENTATRRWAASMKITMHLLSKEEWRMVFEKAGFRTTIRHIRNPVAKEAWKRNAGTLFITGIRPE